MVSSKITLIAKSENPLQVGKWSDPDFAVTRGPKYQSNQNQRVLRTMWNIYDPHATPHTCVSMGNLNIWRWTTRNFFCLYVNIYIRCGIFSKMRIVDHVLSLSLLALSEVVYALRVFPAETRLTVYRRRPVSEMSWNYFFDYIINQNKVFNVFSNIFFQYLKNLKI